MANENTLIEELQTFISPSEIRVDEVGYAFEDSKLNLPLSLIVIVNFEKAKIPAEVWVHIKELALALSDFSSCRRKLLSTSASILEIWDKEVLAENLTTSQAKRLKLPTENLKDCMQSQVWLARYLQDCTNESVKHIVNHYAANLTSSEESSSSFNSKSGGGSDKVEEGKLDENQAENVQKNNSSNPTQEVVETDNQQSIKEGTQEKEPKQESEEASEGENQHSKNEINPDDIIQDPHE